MAMIGWMTDPQAWIALLTLTALEVVLGVDNIIILTILVGRLPQEKRQSARIIGLALAMGTRIILLLSLVWLIHLTQPLFTLFSMPISGRDIVLILGGLFLIAKSTHEIHAHFEDHETASVNIGGGTQFLSIVLQIALIDIVFSLDSVITAVGLVTQVPIMVLAIVIAVLIMMVAAKFIGDFVDKHPTIKILALSFLILIGVALVGEGFDMHIPKGYIYFAMAYALVVELINQRIRKRKPQ
jgi:predicted tellurium resistance membrane protein TerC